MPATLQALLAARLDAVGPTSKLVFQHAALLGDGATAEEISGLGPPGAVAALTSLVDGGLLRHNPAGGFDALDPMLREVAYETLPRHVRGQLHREAAALVTRPDERARHLDRAADYLTDDESVARDAADTLATLGEQLVGESRLADALRLLDRAVTLGSRRPSTLLELARLHELAGDDTAALQTLALVVDDPDDPSIAIQRDHASARTRMFSDPAWARPRLEAVSERWRALGDEEHAAWATANAGVASFNLSRMAEAAADLGRALAVFERANDRAAAVATSSFLCLVTPTDRRVPNWLAEALEFADEAGDRVKQVAALSPLAWHHFLASMWGGPADTIAAERFALQLAELAEEVGADGERHARPEPPCHHRPVPGPHRGRRHPGGRPGSAAPPGTPRTVAGLGRQLRGGRRRRRVNRGGALPAARIPGSGRRGGRTGGAGGTGVRGAGPGSAGPL